MKTLSQQKDYICVEPTEIGEVLQCLEEQVKFIEEKYPNAFADWNEDNCIDKKNHIRQMMNDFYINRNMSALLEIENQILELFKESVSADIMIVEEDANGNCSLTRKDFLRMGYTPAQLDRIGRSFLED